MARFDKSVTIGDITLDPLPGVSYPYNYQKVKEQIASGQRKELDTLRQLFQDDVFFLIYFAWGNKSANHPWIIERCTEANRWVGNEPLLVEWAREHYKSSIWTKGRGLQRLLNDPEERIGIFSASRPIARGFLRSIKTLLETSEILKYCFPDILWQHPEKEAKWSEEEGLFLKRRGIFNEASLEAWGLIEGMPTSKHFSGRINDDVETDVTSSSPEVNEKVIQAYELSHNLGTADGWHWTIGTPYNHMGLMTYLRQKKIYHESIHPATIDGTPNGKPVLLSEERLSFLRANPRTFYAQQLLDPTPKGVAVLDPDNVKEVSPLEIPKNLFKFMLIDPAGVNNNREGDAWAIGVIGVAPYRDDLGLSDVYILDLVAQPFAEIDAINAVVETYLRNGRIIKLGIEKVAMNSTEVHIANALRAKGILVSQEVGNLVLLRPAGRSKVDRIEKNLVWPVANGKLKISTAISKAYRDRLRTEMEKFPYWHDDVIDMLSYLYDVLADYKFPAHPGPPEAERKVDRWERAFERARNRNAERKWMVV